MNLGGLTKSLRKLAGLPSRVSGPFAAWATKDLRAQWSKRADAYGNAWAPYAPASIKRGRGPMLVESGEMRSGTKATPMGGAGVRLEVGHADVAKFHQGGTKHMPARKILPDAGLPARWLRELERLAVADARRTMGGG